MKKNYLKPQIEVVAVRPSYLMAGSGKMGGDLDMTISDEGATGEAEGRGGDFFDED